MKKVISFHQFAAKSFAFVALAFYLSTVPALSYQEEIKQVSEIRYIDRSKGERNYAVPFYHPESDRTQDRKANPGKALLWRIEHTDKRAPIKSSYIFGTIHIDDERVMEIPDSLLHRLIAADALMLELELNDIGSVDMMRKMLFTDGRNLTQVIGEQGFKDVSTALSESGNQIPIDVLAVLKPWAAMLLLIKPDNKTGTFLDKKLATLAKSAGVRVEGLETISEQLSVFDDIEIDDQVSLLQSTMSTMNDKEQAYRLMLDTYLSGDLNALVRVSESQLPEDKRLAEIIYSKLITERNQRMFNRMQNRLQSGNTFIAVGALHLAGESGLLEKIKAAGYQVTRVGLNE